MHSWHGHNQIQTYIQLVVGFGWLLVYKFNVLKNLFTCVLWDWAIALFIISATCSEGRWIIIVRLPVLQSSFFLLKIDFLDLFSDYLSLSSWSLGSMPLLLVWNVHCSTLRFPGPAFFVYLWSHFGTACLQVLMPWPIWWAILLERDKHTRLYTYRYVS